MGGRVGVSFFHGFGYFFVRPYCRVIMSMFLRVAAFYRLKTFSSLHEEGEVILTFVSCPPVSFSFDVSTGGREGEDNLDFGF